MASYTSEINDFSSNKFIVRFSNIVNLTGYELDVHILNNYTKNVSIPDLSIPMLNSLYGHQRQLHPNPIGARDLQTMTIEFGLDERMMNYYLFYCWIYYMRHGKTCGAVNIDNKELLRLDAINAIELVSLNNDNKIISKMRFNHAIINNLSNLQLQSGTSNVVTYICTFEYETLDLLLENTEDK